MISDYTGWRADVDILKMDDPLTYWELKLDLLPRFAQHKLKLLGCPASSVLSEQAFFKKWVVLWQKKKCLSRDMVDQLAFSKVKQSWISIEYQTATVDVNDYIFFLWIWPPKQYYTIQQYYLPLLAWHYYHLLPPLSLPVTTVLPFLNIYCHHYHFLPLMQACQKHHLMLPVKL